MEMCWSFFKVLLKFKMAATNQHLLMNFIILVDEKTVRNYSNFTNTFPIIWRCACDFKVLLKFKIHGINFITFCGRKNSNIEVRNNLNLRSHYPLYGNVQVILLKFNMATTSQFF